MSRARQLIEERLREASMPSTSGEMLRFVRRGSWLFVYLGGTQIASIRGDGVEKLRRMLGFSER